jgi:hypothetical protein
MTSDRDIVIPSEARHLLFGRSFDYLTARPASA